MESTSEMTNQWFVQRVALPMAQGRSAAMLDRREELPSTRDPSSHSKATTTIGAPKLTTYGLFRAYIVTMARIHRLVACLQR